MIPSVSGAFFEIGREHVDDDLHVVAVTLGEERTERSVGEAAHEDDIITRPSLAARIPARNLAGGVVPLFVVNRERKEVGTWPRLFRGGGRCQNQGVTVTHGDGAPGLFR